MKKSLQHVIDTDAQKILEAILPSEWVVNPQKHDYGKDYSVEPAASFELTGCNFWVQLKGKTRIKNGRRPGTISHQLEKKHAAYYLDKVKDLPVFLVVADVKGKQAWWIFLQEFLSQDQSWRRQRSATIYLPRANDFAKFKAFERAVESAKEWLRKQNPFAIQDALEIEVHRVRTIEPRCDVDISVINGVTLRRFTPREPIDLRVTIQGVLDEIAPKIEAFVKGAQVAFKPGELTIEGSRLFDEITLHGGSIAFGKEIDATLTVGLMDASNVRFATLFDIPGKIRVGIGEANFEGQLNNSPLSVSLGPVGSNTAGATNFKLELRKWIGQPISLLAYCNQLNTFFGSISKAVGTEIECMMDGNVIFGIKSDRPLADAATCQLLARWFAFIDKVRKVCARLNINPQWSEEVFERKFENQIEELYGVLFKGGYERKPRPDSEISFGVPKDTANIESLDENGGIGTIVLEVDEEIELLGHVVKIDPMVEVLDGFRVGRSSDDVGGEVIRLVGKSTSESTIKRQLKSESEFA